MPTFRVWFEKKQTSYIDVDAETAAEAQKQIESRDYEEGMQCDVDESFEVTEVEEQA